MFILFANTDYQNTVPLTVVLVRWEIENAYRTLCELMWTRPRPNYVVLFSKEVACALRLAWENSRHLATLPLVSPPNDGETSGSVAKCRLFSWLHCAPLHSEKNFPNVVWGRGRLFPTQVIERCYWGMWQGYLYQNSFRWRQDTNKAWQESIINYVIFSFSRITLNCHESNEPCSIFELLRRNTNQ